MRLIPALDVNGISHVPEVIQAYEQDPKVYGGPIRIRTGSELIRAAHQIVPRLGELHLPYLAVHGGEDPIWQS